MTEKQIAWAEDIRARAVASIKYEVAQLKAEADEARTRYKNNPKRTRTIERKVALAEKAECEAALVIAALTKVKDVKFFINNRSKLNNIKNVKLNLTIDGYLPLVTEPETESTSKNTPKTKVNIAVEGSTEAIDAWIVEATRAGEHLGLDILISTVEVAQR